MTPRFLVIDEVKLFKLNQSHHVESGGGSDSGDGEGGGTNDHLWAGNDWITCSGGKHVSGETGLDGNGHTSVDVGSLWNADNWGEWRLYGSYNFVESSAASSGGEAFDGVGATDG